MRNMVGKLKQPQWQCCVQCCGHTAIILCERKGIIFTN